MLPEILNDPSAENGARILNNIGVDKKFINDVYSKYGTYANKIGLNPGALKGMVDKLGKSVNSNSHTQAPKSERKTNTSFNSSKYPKV